MWPLCVAYVSLMHRLCVAYVPLMRRLVGVFFLFFLLLGVRGSPSPPTWRETLACFKLFCFVSGTFAPDPADPLPGAKPSLFRLVFKRRRLFANAACCPPPHVLLVRSSCFKTNKFPIPKMEQGLWPAQTQILSLGHRSP